MEYNTITIRATSTHAIVTVETGGTPSKRWTGEYRADPGGGTIIPDWPAILGIDECDEFEEISTVVIGAMDNSEWSGDIPSPPEQDLAAR